MTRQRDFGLEALLGLDGEVFFLENGYWTKFEARLIDPATPERPHGVRYCLTLHDRHNRRVLGFDNAHAAEPRRRGFSGRKTAWDHRHNRNKVEEYEYQSAAELLEDFWRAVEAALTADKG